MSKLDSEKPTQKDIFAVYHENIDNFYSNIEKSIPVFHQAATNLVQEYIQAWNNIATSFVDIQREFTTKAGIKSNLPIAISKLAKDSNDEINKIVSINNKISVASIDAAKQNVRTWNENYSSFAELNKNIIDSCVSTLSFRS